MIILKRAGQPGQLMLVFFNKMDLNRSTLLKQFNFQDSGFENGVFENCFGLEWNHGVEWSGVEFSGRSWP